MGRHRTALSDTVKKNLTLLSTKPRQVQEFAVMARKGSSMRRIVAGLLAIVLALTLHERVAAQQALTIEKLLTEGWEIAGYIAVADNRSLILFKHANIKSLVQCSVLIDVTRNPRVVTYCYELK
jgi:hypothetical protein